MAKLPKPSKPLKILTIDGGGLQGISTLLILDKVLRAIARNNGVPNSKPRPCDVFDVIAGIGPGGWLALLLGRFQMDVSAALAEWYNLIECIAPRSKAEKLRMRLMQHTYFDTDRLVEQIDQLTEFYETDTHMFFEPPSSTRCKHVFVSALKTDSKDRHLGYNLFRTYECPKGSKLLDGPSDPRKYKISHAFGVTGAAKYFTPPWKETSAKKGISKFLDIQFPSPHNITELALNEMWGLYGTDVEISVVVNIGPGIPNASDCKNIARRFSWGSKVATISPALPNRGLSPDAKEISNDPKRVQSHDYEPTDKFPPNESELSRRVKFDQKLSPPAGDTERSTPIARHTTFGSEQNIGIEEKLRRDENRIEADIRRKLRNVYEKNTPPYYRLAPERSAPGTAQNDTSSPKASFDATTQYLHVRRVEIDMEEVGQLIPFEIPLPAG
ncbi:MAG: hypothetical protein ALECFALPRED_004209 [Alectoria fallacina]|uniref:PNPLA domain-containing protein n=1 Tax=Alectoria fallacina TaxID=1903189 RepID=A0A8H3EPB3_9LECA|nr:MAG: hypothetical protein ALECFALPRED_004209 [Alectoria fallacina]